MGAPLGGCKNGNLAWYTDPPCIPSVGSALTQLEGGTAELHFRTGRHREARVASLRIPLMNYILQQSFSVSITKLEPVWHNCQPHSAPLQLLHAKVSETSHPRWKEESTKCKPSPATGHCHLGQKAEGQPGQLLIEKKGCFCSSTRAHSLLKWILVIEQLIAGDSP